MSKPGQPRLLHVITRDVGFRTEIAEEIPVCVRCKAELDHGTEAIDLWRRHQRHLIEVKPMTLVGIASVKVPETKPEIERLRRLPGGPSEIAKDGTVENGQRRVKAFIKQQPRK